MQADQLRPSIVQVVETVWESTLALPAVPIDARSGAPDGHRTYVGLVQITGAWDGAVAVQCDHGLARHAAMAMLGLTEADVTIEDVRDALGELVNMIGGNLKALLAEPCVLGLPVVVEGAELRMMLPGSRQVVQCAFAADHEPFTVTVLQRAPA